MRKRTLGAFQIDTRALAAFRIALGLIIIADLLFRTARRQTFYSDYGVLPRSAVPELVPTLGTPSLYMMSGEPWVIGVIFLLSGVLALALTVGVRAQLVAAALLILQTSLYLRNPYLVHGGDGIILIALFFAIFLPTGERWSIEAGEQPRDRTTIANIATLGILLQLVLIYTANAMFKLHSPIWRSGNAVANVVQLEQYSIGIGPYLTDIPALLWILNWTWIVLLAGAFLLIWSAHRVRIAIVCGFVFFHIGMLATMQLGLFPLAVIAILLLYLPSSIWEWIDEQVHVRAGERFRLSPRQFGLPRFGKRVIAVVLVILITTSVVWPAVALAGESSASMEGVDYPYTLFAPNPPTDSHWFAITGTFGEETRIDPLTGDPIEWDTPVDAERVNRGTYWNSYLNEMRGASESTHRALGQYLCEYAWNTHTIEISDVTVYRVFEPTRASGGGERHAHELLTTSCAEPL